MDLSMLSSVGHSIAMKNATDEVKAIASTITERTNDEDGLLDILLSLAKDNAEQYKKQAIICFDKYEKLVCRR